LFFESYFRLFSIRKLTKIVNFLGKLRFIKCHLWVFLFHQKTRNNLVLWNEQKTANLNINLDHFGRKSEWKRKKCALNTPYTSIVHICTFVAPSLSLTFVALSPSLPLFLHHSFRDFVSFEEIHWLILPLLLNFYRSNVNLTWILWLTSILCQKYKS